MKTNTSLNRGAEVNCYFLHVCNSSGWFLAFKQDTWAGDLLSESYCKNFGQHYRNGERNPDLEREIRRGGAPKHRAAGPGDDGGGGRERCRHHTVRVKDTGQERRPLLYPRLGLHWLSGLCSQRRILHDRQLIPFPFPEWCSVSSTHIPADVCVWIFRPRLVGHCLTEVSTDLSPLWTATDPILEEGRPGDHHRGLPWVRLSPAGYWWRSPLQLHVSQSNVSKSRVRFVCGEVGGNSSVLWTDRFDQCC